MKTAIQLKVICSVHKLIIIINNKNNISNLHRKDIMTETSLTPKFLISSTMNTITTIISIYTLLIIKAHMIFIIIIITLNILNNIISQIKIIIKITKVINLSKAKKGTTVILISRKVILIGVKEFQRETQMRKRTATFHLTNLDLMNNSASLSLNYL